MVEVRKNPPIYDALLAVKPSGLKLGTWAKSAGFARNVFNDIRRHGNPKRETLQRLLDAINVSFVQFDAGMAPVQTEVQGAGIVGAGDVRRAFHGEEPLKALPLIGTAIGGEYGDLDEQIELVELHLNEVLEYLVRPKSMASDQDAYAVTILGDSMSPRFEPGDRLAVSPRDPTKIGDDVIVQLRGSDGGDERVTMVLVKRLVRQTATYTELRQFNPDVHFRVDAKRVKAMHKVKGVLF